MDGRKGGQVSNRPPLPIGKSPIYVGGDSETLTPGQAIRQCAEHVHVFADFGYCQCGAEFWESPVPDTLPEQSSP